ncbi:MAG: molybdenum cofactor guanylyltransferase [Deltaproteobacteria bacterium]|nr:molybdenum cofactor guanylyltransferase [Deltaproteobacteria bacterium]MBW1960393.1 molybdenum cofactor guanylyltransferase [Deltaproteobacteria bacterium]MBW2151651.1 molybdenum cofactor guanylyltransferase [Deltaproteobacteria bacterium]
MKYSLSGVILAGGMSKRFSGKEKALLTVGESRIIDRIFAIFQEIFEEIILVTNNPLCFLEWNANIVTDIFSIRSALTGIHAGLFYSTYSHAFFCACDTPFLKKEIVNYVISCVTPKLDVILPATSAGLEPLCAVYSKNILPAIEKHLSTGDYKIAHAIKKCRIHRIPESELRYRDPKLLSFFNVNTPEDLKKAKEIESKIKYL